VGVEGNYLLANVAPWSSLAPLFDLTVSLDVPQAELKERILERWAGHGRDRAEAERRWTTNDGPNATWVQQNSISADVVVRLPVPE
jgi:pantothenate kinase